VALIEKLELEEILISSPAIDAEAESRVRAICAARARRGAAAVPRNQVNSGRFRVGVDGRAFSSPAGGVRRYVREIYGALPSVAPDVDVIAIGAVPSDTLPPGVTPYPARDFPTNLGWMAASIPLAARGAHLDVFHAPAYTAPLWGGIRRRSRFTT